MIMIRILLLFLLLKTKKNNKGSYHRKYTTNVRTCMAYHVKVTYTSI